MNTSYDKICDLNVAQHHDNDDEYILEVCILQCIFLLISITSFLYARSKSLQSVRLKCRHRLLSIIRTTYDLIMHLVSQQSGIVHNISAVYWVRRTDRCMQTTTNVLMRWKFRRRIFCSFLNYVSSRFIFRPPVFLPRVLETARILIQFGKQS